MVRQDARPTCLQVEVGYLPALFLNAENLYQSQRAGAKGAPGKKKIDAPACEAEDHSQDDRKDKGREDRRSDSQLESTRETPHTEMKNGRKEKIGDDPEIYLIWRDRSAADTMARSSAPGRHSQVWVS